MIRRKVNRNEYEAESYLAWNAFVDLLAIEDFDDLTEIQRNAFLLFWYDSEVHNGGHFQYFVNSAGNRAKDTILALSTLNMHCLSKVLQQAYDYVSLNPIDEIDSADDFVIQASDVNFRKFDESFYRCGKIPMDYLESYLEKHFEHFIELV